MDAAVFSRWRGHLAGKLAGFDQSMRLCGFSKRQDPVDVNAQRACVEQRCALFEYPCLVLLGFGPAEVHGGEHQFLADAQQTSFHYFIAIGHSCHNLNCGAYSTGHQNGSCFCGRSEVFDNSSAFNPGENP
jgi:hypothetical protein